MRGVITAEELVERLAEVTVLDVRWQLGRDDGEERYLDGHVPGASYVDLERDLTDPPSRPVDGRGRHPLPDPERFAEAMCHCGVRMDMPVVVMDDSGGLSAARCWWLLRHHGHDDVRVLDGGWARWQALGLPSERGPCDSAAGDFTAAPGRLPLIDHEGAARVAREGVLLDARSPVRFRGDQEPVDPVAGHVPGAHNVPATANLDDEGALLPEGRLRARYGAVLDATREHRPVAAYCGSGVTAALDLLALHALGVDAALYAGSWSGWVADPERPVTAGGE
jgi:thiosulfate/3-mercaptopyruvate sulfurtransferase